MSNEIRKLSEVEVGNIHQWMATLFKSFGLRGDALDNAISGAFTPAWQAIDQHRQAKQDVSERRASLKLVAGTDTAQ